MSILERFRLDTPETVLRERLRRRWECYDLGPEEIADKVEGNDLPNGRFVAEHNDAAEFTISDLDWGQAFATATGNDASVRDAKEELGANDGQ